MNAAGVGVAAGDIGGLTGERQRLAALAQSQGAAIRGTTKDSERTRLAKEQAETQKQLAAVNKELARLADQSGRVDDMFAEMERNAEAIGKEREKREAVTAVVEEFVVGGQDTRQALVQAATGVRKAFASGTLQNQTEEQRAATVGFLDKLGDVELLGGFTGREIKQELVFRDAIRMGLDPRIAEQLATATSTEEKLIQANELLAFEINKLSGQMQAAQQGLDPANVAQAPVVPKLARGGLIYRANGGSIFQPKGTDTVPAMLTPGEFVIRKSAVDAIGTDTLAAINGGASYFDNGGEVEDILNPKKRGPQNLKFPLHKFSPAFWQEMDEKADAKQKKRLAELRKKTANDSIMMDMAIRDGYVPSLSGTKGVMKFATANENLSQQVEGPEQYLYAKFMEREQARAEVQQNAQLEAKAFMAINQKMAKDGGRLSLSDAELEDIRKNYLKLSKKDFLKQYEAIREIRYQMQKPEEAAAAEAEFGGPQSAVLDDFGLSNAETIGARLAVSLAGGLTSVADEQQRIDQEQQKQIEKEQQQRKTQQAYSDIGSMVSQAGSFVSGLASRATEMYNVGAAKIEEEKTARLAANKEAFEARRKAERNTSTAASRKAARLSGIKSGLSGTTDQQANQARYDRILRTNGPAAAQRFAKSQNFTPAGGAGAGTGSGITQAFRNRPNMMGSPQAMQQFQQFQQYQQFLRYQQQQQFRGGVRFRAAGGGISGSDTVPAMLTPGEFVMSAGAVRQHGVGTMRALNRGQVKGFNRGGLVGGTQYLQNGGQATGGIDLSQISQTFDKITASITKLSTNLESLNERFGFFEMQHTVTVDGQINLPGIDGGAIAQQITDSIGGLVAEEVKKALDNPEARP